MFLPQDSIPLSIPVDSFSGFAKPKSSFPIGHPTNFSLAFEDKCFFVVLCENGNSLKTRINQGIASIFFLFKGVPEENQEIVDFARLWIKQYKHSGRHDFLFLIDQDSQQISAVFECAEISDFQILKKLDMIEIVFEYTMAFVLADKLKEEWY